MFYDKQFRTVTTHKNFPNYCNKKCTYNGNTHCNLLCTLKVWNCLNFIRKGNAKFFCLVKFLFSKVRCLINVNKIYGLLIKRMKDSRMENI